MRNPFLNSTELFNKTFQQQAELGTKLMSSMLESMSEQLQLTMDTNRKIAELITNQMNAATKANLNMWNEISNVFNKQVEVITDNVQNVQKEAEKVVKTTK
ncbi:MAG: hypothetical protein KatS3mg035_0120 [Bacteroidia bacterium]|nr:MAG: hypothetical protein KatS3mg035_0120 [Bacteroidia bacterium]